MLRRFAARRSLADLKIPCLQVVAAILLAGNSLDAQRSVGLQIPPATWKYVTVVGVVDGKEIRTCLKVLAIKNPADDFQPGSDVETDFREAEDKDYPDRLWNRIDGPRWSHDCAGHVMMKNWGTGKYKVGAPKFYKEIVQRYGYQRRTVESYQPGDVVVWFDAQGEAKHVAVVLNSGFTQPHLRISTKDNERSTFEGPLHYQESGVLKHPLNHAYQGKIEIWRVRHIRFEESECGKASVDGKYVLQSGPIVDPNKVNGVKQSGDGQAFSRWDVQPTVLTFHREARNPASSDDVTVDFAAPPAEFEVGKRVVGTVVGTVAATFEGKPLTLNPGVSPNGNVPNAYYSFSNGGGNAFIAQAQDAKVKPNGTGLAFEEEWTLEFTGGKDPVIISLFVQGGHVGDVEVSRWVYTFQPAGFAPSGSPSLTMAHSPDDGRMTHVPTRVTADAKPPADLSFTARLVAAHSQRCLDVVGGDNLGQGNGAVAHQWECLNVRSQEWNFRRTGDGQHVQIRAGHSQKCLDLDQQKTGNHTRVHQWDCHGGDSQLWAMIDRGHGTFALVSKAASRCIDIYNVSTDNGAIAQLYDCHYAPNQLFSHDYGSTVTPSTVTPSTSNPASSTSNTNSSSAATPLKLFWSAARGDNFTTATPTGERDALSAGYVFVRIEGYVFPTQQPGTVPLKLFYHAARGDNFTTASAQGEQAALGSGYGFVRVEGYVYPSQQAGTVPLKNYWHGNRADNFATSTADGQRAAQGSGYAFTWIEGYLPPAGAMATTTTGGSDSGLGGLWRYRLTCGQAEVEGVFTLAPDAGGTFDGKGDGPWEPGTVTLSDGSLRGNHMTGLKFMPDAWVEPYIWTGQLSGANSERIDGEAQRSTGACRFFMDRNAGPAPGFEPLGTWRYHTTCSPRTASGTITLTTLRNDRYVGRLAGPWEGVPSGDVWDGRAFGREFKFTFRPDGWNEGYIWRGEYSNGGIDGQVFWRGQPACTFTMRR